MELPPPPDDPLIAAARDGNFAAWAELTRRHRPPLVRSFAVRVGCPVEAEDLAQETFADAYRRSDRLRPDLPFAPWLYGIARFVLLRHRRHLWQTRHASLDALVACAGDVVADPRQDDPIAAVAARDPIDRVLAGLTPTLRDALLLHDVGGLTAPEIAALLGITPHAAERRVGRAKAAFRCGYVALAGGTPGPALDATVVVAAAGVVPHGGADPGRTEVARGPAVGPAP